MPDPPDRLHRRRGPDVRLLRDADRLGGWSHGSVPIRCSMRTASRTTRTSSRGSPGMRLPEAGPYRTYAERSLRLASAASRRNSASSRPPTRCRDSRVIGRGLAGLPRLDRGLAPAEAPLPPRRPDQLRRRPVRGFESTARGRLRLDRDRPAGRFVQAGRTQLPRHARAAGATARTHRPRGAEPVSRPCARQTAGLTTVWIDRRHDRPGSGATPPADARPDATYPDMASFAGPRSPPDAARPSREGLGCPSQANDR